METTQRLPVGTPHPARYVDGFGNQPGLSCVRLTLPHGSSTSKGKALEHSGACREAGFPQRGVQYGRGSWCSEAAIVSPEYVLRRAALAGNDALRKSRPCPVTSLMEGRRRKRSLATCASNRLTRRHFPLARKSGQASGHSTPDRPGIWNTCVAYTVIVVREFSSSPALTERNRRIDMFQQKPPVTTQSRPQPQPMPAPGPSNIIVRTPNPSPPPDDVLWQ